MKFCIKINILIILLLLTLPLYSNTSRLRIEGKAKKGKGIIEKSIRDKNDNKAALISFITDLEGGITFRPGKGEVKIENSEDGRWDIYVSEGERSIVINKAGYLEFEVILNTYGISNLKSGDIYELILTGDKKETSEIATTFSITPESSILEIDGKVYDSQKAISLPEGTYPIKISNEGYETIEENINLTKDNIHFTYDLKYIDLVPFKIISNPEGADIYLNNSNKGKTNNGLFILPDEYNLKLILPGYLEINETINISSDSENKFEYDLVRNIGFLQLEIIPEDASIKLNNKEMTNLEINELAPGSYKLEIYKNGYYSIAETIKIQLGKTTEERIDLKPKLGKLKFKVFPITAKCELYKDSKLVTSWEGLNLLKNLMIGDYKVNCSSPGYEPKTFDVVIKHNEMVSYVEELIKTEDQIDSNTMKFTNYTSPTGTEMVAVEGGSFQMGSKDGNSDEKPIHSVTLDDFYIGKYEVTQKEWKEIMGKNPSYFKGDNNPAERVSWYDVIEFCNKKSEKEGLTPCYTGSGKNIKFDKNATGYRLPTEAEWEYAARGASTTLSNHKYAGSNSIDMVAWYTNNSGSKTHSVGEKHSNELGVHDMSGNVREWCWDWHGDYGNASPQNPIGADTGRYRVVRGGGCYYSAYYCRVGSRYFNYPEISYNDLGFRLARSLK